MTEDRDIKIIVNLYYSPTQELKDILQRNCGIYVPINGGSGLRGDEWAESNCIFDDTGDNISQKNKLLNEMTSIYWTWKHYGEIGNPDYIGFNHYRRFFDIEDIRDYREFDLIVSKPIFSSDKISLIQQYAYYHVLDDMLKCISVLMEHDNKFGNGFFDYVNSSGTNFAPCNMFVMKRHLFFEWCSFLFPVLSDLEKSVDIDGRDNYQKRALCFLTERIFNYWCYLKVFSHAVKEVKIVEHMNFKPIGINERGDYT